MNRLEIRELSAAIVKIVGTGEQKRIPRTLHNTVINDVIREYFRRTRSLHSFIHALVAKGQFEYKLPADVLKIERVTVDNQVYVPRTFPLIVDDYEIGNDADQVPAT